MDGDALESMVLIRCWSQVSAAPSALCCYASLTSRASSSGKPDARASVPWETILEMAYPTDARPPNAMTRPAHNAPRGSASVYRMNPQRHALNTLESATVVMSHVELHTASSGRNGIKPWVEMFQFKRAKNRTPIVT